MTVERDANHQKPFEAISDLFRRSVKSGDIAGVVAVGATQDGVVYEGEFGNADVAAGSPMLLDTVFWVASMTKAVTATACMQLMEEGLISLDQVAADILPELASPQVLEGFGSDGLPRLRPAKNAITVRHLLTHTSGYTYSAWSDMLAQYEQATGTPIIFAGKNSAFTVPLEFEPGERWKYGMSMDWVGKLVEAVSGQSLEIYFREKIFVPLGMKDTGYLIGTEQKRRVATAMQRQSDGSLEANPYEPPQRPEFFSGGAHLFSTPRDYMTFLQMLLNKGRMNGVEILRSETVSSMMTNHIGDLQVVEMKAVYPTMSKDFDLFPGKSHKWGLSFDINEHDVPGGRRAGSIAWAGALNTHYWVDPVAKVTGALFTQVWPFCDEKVVALFAEFEQALYKATGRN